MTLGVKDMARFLGCSEKTIYNRVWAGEIEAEKRSDGRLSFSIDAPTKYLGKRRPELLAPRRVSADAANEQKL